MYAALMTPQHEIIKDKQYLCNVTAAENALKKFTLSDTKPAIAIVRCTHSVAVGEKEAIANGSIIQLDVKFGDTDFSQQSADGQSEILKISV